MSASALQVEPAYRSLPDSVSTLGPEVADLAELAGLTPDPEQRMVLDAIFATDQRGRSAAFETAVVASRQNLKTAAFRMAALGWLFLTDERLIVWSAHEFRTSQEAFRDIAELVENCSYLRARLKAIYRGNGDESIELANGHRLIFKARTKSGGRGLSGDKVILDEAFALQPAHMGALLPTLSARPDPQVLYGSSAGLSDSAVLRGVRDRGRAGGDPRLAYLEWCAPPPQDACEAGDKCTHQLGAEGCGCDDPALWARSNPALGRRITVDYIAAERRALPPLEFGRERMGWWDDPIGGDENPFPPDSWSRCLDVGSTVTDPVALAIDVAPDRSSSAIAAFGTREDGLGHAEVIEHRGGTGWLVGRLIELAERHQPCAVALDPASPAGAMETELTERGFRDDGTGEWRLHLVGARQYAQACGALVDATINRRLRHVGQPPLNRAIENVITRPLAGAYAWSRKGGHDITPLVSVTLARSAFELYKTDDDLIPLGAWR